MTIPGHALHEKGLQRQISAGPLVSSQERRAAVVPRVNRGLCSSIGLHRNSCVRASGESFKRVVFDPLGGKRVGRLLGGPTRRRPVLPGPAPPRRAPPRPDPPVVCPGFGFDRFFMSFRVTRVEIILLFVRMHALC